MDTKRKKELLDEYKNRHPQMGIISLRCKTTNDMFLGTSIDTHIGFNSNTAKLNSKTHTNKSLQELWNKYGMEGFEFTVLKVLKYENTGDDHTDELNKLCDKCLEENKQARRIWK